MTALHLTASIEKWPIRGGFTISRGAKTEAVAVVATVSDGVFQGRGECTPYARYGENPEGVLQEILGLAAWLRDGGTREALQAKLGPGAARNALDCALWDYEAKRTGRSVFEMAGRAPAEVPTAFTISLASPDKMAADASAAASYPLLKLKLGGGAEDGARIAAVRTAAPHVRLIVDANEAWSRADFPALAEICAAEGVELIEQPFPAGADDALRDLARPVPVCADESVFTAADLPRLAGLYDAVNIKLDKAGGLTEALRLATAARDAGMKIMLGCMVATSLAMAPALVLAGDADWVDLDGPLLLEADRSPGLRYDGALVSPPSPELWG